MSASNLAYYVWYAATVGILCVWWIAMFIVIWLSFSPKETT